MRITGGTFRGRKLQVPSGKDVRPATDQVRQAVFNMLVSYDLPNGARVLDGFCGSGAYGLESLSRGAQFCTFMDNAVAAQKACGANITALELKENSRFIKTNVTKPPACAGGFCDLVFLDPPYWQELLQPAVNALCDKGWIGDSTICVLECEKGAAPILPHGFAIDKDKNYGRTRIVIGTYPSIPE